MPEKPRYTNRLIGEKSPYLLQHAHNPVDWYPWGQEAFDLAKSTGKPIFLSIGYATCHWCHVMERESFEEENIARLMNETFINIKVDREEQPEVDALYMEFAQSMMAGSAGWPLNILLTPDLQPFFAATYLPPTGKLGLMGLEELIQRIQQVWNSEEQQSLIQQANNIVSIFKQNQKLQGTELPNKAAIEKTAEILYKMADPVFGGIRGAPKFPIGYQVSFMIAYAALTQDGRASFLAERTLQMMSQGGIYDHLGGGFARYSIDEKWIVPHFEKMLYDNAILANCYLEGWLFSRADRFIQIVHEVLEYILKEMKNPEGGFFSAQDSETEGEEGRFYLWKDQEIRKLLGDDAEIFCAYYGVTPKGQLSGKNVLHNPLELDEFCFERRLEQESVKKILEKGRSILTKVRKTRTKPFKDDKILCSWNAMMIHTMALAGRTTANESYLNAATHAAQFIEKNMWDGHRLMRRYRDGEALASSSLDDYAYLIRACLTLFETLGNTRWLQWAMTLTNVLETHYKVEGGAFYQTSNEDRELIIRHCLFSDGAEPSGNSIHCENLLRLYHMTLHPGYLDQAEDILKAVKHFLDNYSPGYLYHIHNLQRYYSAKTPTLVISLNDSEDDLAELQNAVFNQYIPYRNVIWRREIDSDLLNLIPFLKEQKPIDGKTTLYLCHLGMCNKPINSLDKMLETIENL